MAKSKFKVGDSVIVEGTVTGVEANDDGDRVTIEIKEQGEGTARHRVTFQADELKAAE